MGRLLFHNKGRIMIKRKGVCDVCAEEFELSEGTFAMRIIEDDIDHSRKKWTITVLDCIDDCSEQGFFQVCGITCLYEAIADVVDRRKEESKFRTIGHEAPNDSTVQILDLTDKRAK